MAKGDFYAFPKQVENALEWTVRLATVNTTRFTSKTTRDNNKSLYRSLLSIAESNSDFAQYEGDADAVFSAIFGGAGVKINPSLIDSGVVPASRGDMLSVKSTFQEGYFVSEQNIEASTLVDLDMDFATQSHVAGLLAMGKSYFSSFGWYVLATRTPNYAGIGPLDPFYTQKKLPEDATKFEWENMLTQARVSEVTSIFLGGKLVNVSTYAGATKNVTTGNIKLIGRYAVNHSPIAQIT